MEVSGLAKFTVHFSHVRLTMHIVGGNVTQIVERVVLWLVGSPPDQAVQVQDVAWHIDCVVFLQGKTLLCLSTQVYKWVTENLMLRVMLGGNTV